MTAGELRVWTVGQLEALGVKMDNLIVWPSQDAAVWALLTEGLQKWTSFSEHLRDSVVAFAVANGVATYKLRDTAIFARPMKRIDVVRDDFGTVLVNFRGEQGRISRADLDRFERDWGNRTPARPSVWLMEGTSTIRLYAEPDDDYAFEVAGVCLHSALTADADEIQIEPEDELAVARWCAALWAMKSGQASEGISLAYREGIEAAQERGAETVRVVTPRAGGVEGGCFRW